MSLREELVAAAATGEFSIAALARQFNVSRKTVYKWINRARLAAEVQIDDSQAALENRSCRPKHSPSSTNEGIEENICALRQQHPEWGARKLHKLLINQSTTDETIVVPSLSTITRILHRHGLIAVEESRKRVPFIRFEHAAPNQLWQMDFKGDFPLSDRQRCHILTVLDDHSRYSVCLRACANVQRQTVVEALRTIFRAHGLPERMTMDNGAPWGSALPLKAWYNGERRYTQLTVWLMRLGIGVSHSRPHHPQTQGKDERFHRTLQQELLRHHSFADLASCQQHLDRWQSVYNTERPHEALDLEVPASRYQRSVREYPEQLPAIEYAAEDQLRRVQKGGHIHFRGRTYRLSTALEGLPVGLRPTEVDGVWQVSFCQFAITKIDLRTPERS
jgi:transposase InsO family protein